MIARFNTFLFFVVVLLSHFSMAQRNAHLEFSLEIDHESNQLETYTIISVDTFTFSIETFNLINGEFSSSGWNEQHYDKFKVYSDNNFTYKVYETEDEYRLTISYSKDTIFATYTGDRVRNGIVHFSSILDNGTIKIKPVEPYNRESARCLTLNVVNTNFLLRNELNSLRIDYDGQNPKELELKSDNLPLTRKSWHYYEVIPDELDTVEVFITRKNGDTLYSEFFIVVDNHDRNFKDFKTPPQNCCDKITTFNNIRVLRSKNQRLVLRSKNFDSTQFRFEIQNGELISNVNNILNIKWGKEDYGFVIIHYGENFVFKQFFLIQD